jgi:hypothetical protein
MPPRCCYGENIILLFSVPVYYSVWFVGEIYIKFLNL